MECRGRQTDSPQAGAPLHPAHDIAQRTRRLAHPADRILDLLCLGFETQVTILSHAHAQDIRFACRGDKRFGENRFQRNRSIHSGSAKKYAIIRRAFHRSGPSPEPRAAAWVAPASAAARYRQAGRAVRASPSTPSRLRPRVCVDPGSWQGLNGGCEALGKFCRAPLFSPD